MIACRKEWGRLYFMSNIKLKSCPFCGNDAAAIKTKTVQDGYCHYTVKYVACEHCGVRTMERICDGYYGGSWSDKEAANDWNRRVR